MTTRDTNLSPDFDDYGSLPNSTMASFELNFINSNIFKWAFARNYKRRTH